MQQYPAVSSSSSGAAVAVMADTVLAWLAVMVSAFS